MPNSAKQLFVKDMFRGNFIAIFFLFVRPLKVLLLVSHIDAVEGGQHMKGGVHGRLPLFFL